MLYQPSQMIWMGMCQKDGINFPWIDLGYRKSALQFVSTTKAVCIACINENRSPSILHDIAVNAHTRNSRQASFGQ